MVKLLWKGLFFSKVGQLATIIYCWLWCVQILAWGNTSTAWYWYWHKLGSTEVFKSINEICWHCQLQGTRTSMSIFFFFVTWSSSTYISNPLFMSVTLMRRWLFGLLYQHNVPWWIKRDEFMMRNRILQVPFVTAYLETRQVWLTIYSLCFAIQVSPVLHHFPAQSPRRRGLIYLM